MVEVNQASSAIPGMTIEDQRRLNELSVQRAFTRSVKLDGGESKLEKRINRLADRYPDHADRIRAIIAGTN